MLPPHDEGALVPALAVRVGEAPVAMELTAVETSLVGVAVGKALHVRTPTVR